VARLFGDPTINLIDVTPQASERGVSATIGNTAILIGEQYRAAVGRTSLLGVRPEAIRIGPAAAGAIAADVVAVTPLNERLVTLLKTGDGHEIWPRSRRASARPRPTARSACNSRATTSSCSTRPAASG
jgi:multiple sugar transport system ATP-binding protein